MPLVFAAFIGIGIQTFSEELIFRGYATQGILLVFKKPLMAAIVSGLFFGAVHIPNGIPQALNATIFGIVCAMLTIRTGSIALTTGLHLANNYFGAALLVSGSDVFQGSPGLFTQNTPHLMWWDLCLSILGLIGVTWLFFRRPFFAGPPSV
jgi:membrane protease YdiL (CAAX protease family)